MIHKVMDLVEVNLDWTLRLQINAVHISLIINLTETNKMPLK